MAGCDGTMRWPLLGACSAGERAKRQSDLEALHRARLRSGMYLSGIGSCQPRRWALVGCRERRKFPVLFSSVLGSPRLSSTYYVLRRPTTPQPRDRTVQDCLSSVADISCSVNGTLSAQFFIQRPLFIAIGPSDLPAKILGTHLMRPGVCPHRVTSSRKSSSRPS